MAKEYRVAIMGATGAVGEGRQRLPPVCRPRWSYLVRMGPTRRGQCAHRILPNLLHSACATA